MACYFCKLFAFVLDYKSKLISPIVTKCILSESDFNIPNTI